jgi:uncharacterized FlaG/YvyC family protein
MKIEKLNINVIVNQPLIRKEDLGYRDSLEIKNPQKEPNYIPKDGEQVRKNAQSVTFYKAFFAIDENKNVVIKVVDQEGNLVRQIPPEEYLKVAESMKMISKKLLHLEV